MQSSDPNQKWIKKRNSKMEKFYENTTMISVLVGILAQPWLALSFSGPNAKSCEVDIALLEIIQCDYLIVII